MGFFNRMLASIGIGNAQVDTRLETNRLRVGDEIRGVVHIKGGNVEQRIDGIYLQLMTQYLREHDDNKVWVNGKIASIPVAKPGLIRAGETLEIPFAFTLPLNTPVSIGRTPIWIKTSLDIENAVDPSDNDSIEVYPHPYMQTILEACEQLGFRLKQSACEYSPRLGRGLPFVQEFEFYPSPEFRGRVDELELVFYVNPDGVELIVEVDRRARGFGGFLEKAFDMDERKQLLRFSAAELSQGTSPVAKRIADTISHHSR